MYHAVRTSYCTGVCRTVPCLDSRSGRSYTSETTVVNYTYNICTMYINMHICGGWGVGVLHRLHLGFLKKLFIVRCFLKPRLPFKFTYKYKFGIYMYSLFRTCFLCIFNYLQKYIVYHLFNYKTKWYVYMCIHVYILFVVVQSEKANKYNIYSVMCAKIICKQILQIFINVYCIYVYIYMYVCKLYIFPCKYVK